MDTPSSQPWSQSEPQVDSLAGISADLEDLGNLFDFGDIDINLDNIDGQYGDSTSHAQHISNPHTPFGEMNLAGGRNGTQAQDFGSHEQFGMHHHNTDKMQYGGQPPVHDPFASDTVYRQPMQQSYQQPHSQQYQYQSQSGLPTGYGVPPTPNSYEMHGEVGRFMQQQNVDPQQHAILEQRYNLRKDDAMAFTPMVSPAGTPQRAGLSEFTIPGAYFSPLTSPLLHAQMGGTPQQSTPQQQFQGYYTNPSTAPSSITTSPIDLSGDVNMADGMVLPDPAMPQTRASKRKVATPRSVTAGNRVRQSPIQKPQKRKSATLSQVVTSSDEVLREAQQVAKSAPGSARLQAPAVKAGSSEDSSISPESLSEAVMGPPPRPGSSVNQSPAITGQHENDTTCTATPKSLLSGAGAQQRINGSTAEGAGSTEGGALDDLQLPAAADQASEKPNPGPINTSTLATATPSGTTTRQSARKTPKLGPLSTPSSALPQSAVASPSGGSPMIGSAPGHLLKDKNLESKGGRGAKKRGSTGPNGLMSPAIRPKISPSIKPLLPEGTPLHSPQHALLLASKSNYQNILEGNQLPGVNYPDSLSTGLTSKRTSHKVAEQGRRNRINDALKEMQSLLPRDGQAKSSSNKENSSEDSPEAGGSAEMDMEKRKEAAVKSNSSKAATVESANVYIRAMQEQMAALIAENLELKKGCVGTSAASPMDEGDGPKAVDSASPTSAKAQ